MKRIVALTVVLAAALAALYFAQRRHRTDAVSPEALVNTAADWQRDLTRAPMHMTRLSDGEEIRIGDQLAAQYGAGQDASEPESKALEVYVQKVGARVASQAKRPMPWKFHLVCDKNLINAFALPGGQVFVGQGLLDQMHSEDELAFVVGHEIEHVDHYHAAERVQVQAQLHHFDLDIVAALAEIPMSIWQEGYSKDEELEADREGLRLAVSAGYSPQGAVKLLERWTQLHREYVIHAETPIDELSQVAIEGLNGYFRSHPLPAERLIQIRAVIAEDHLPVNRPLTPFHLEYEITTATAPQ